MSFQEKKKLEKLASLSRKATVLEKRAKFAEVRATQLQRISKAQEAIRKSQPSAIPLTGLGSTLKKLGLSLPTKESVERANKAWGLDKELFR